MYSIGEVSEMFDLPVSTLRYYDKEGLFPDMMRVSGVRKFSDGIIRYSIILPAFFPPNRMSLIRIASFIDETSAIFIIYDIPPCIVIFLKHYHIFQCFFF